MELMVSMSLLAIFIGAMYETVLTGLRAVNASDERERLRMELTNTLDRLTREASMARNVDRATDTRVQFDADYDGSGTSTGAENNVNYEYDAANDILKRSDGSGSTITLASYVTSLDFDYLDSAGSPTYTSCDSTSGCGSAGDGTCCRSEVRVVLITMTGTNDQETVSVTDAVNLRNM